jgi:hypothetical protein
VLCSNSRKIAKGHDLHDDVTGQNGKENHWFDEEIYDELIDKTYMLSPKSAFKSVLGSVRFGGKLTQLHRDTARTPPNKVINLPPLGFRFQCARKIELEILHISVYFALIL